MVNSSAQGTDNLLEKGLSGEEFESLRTFAKAHWGFEIIPSKKTLVENRLSSLCRKQKLPSPSEALQRLFQENNQEFEILVFDTLSTNLTSFFRDHIQFDFFDKQVLEPFKNSGGNSQLRIWSAGCSIGCEPYSLAIRCKELLPPNLLGKTEILGTDYSVSVLNQAKKAVFQLETIKDLPEALLHRHFLKGIGKAEGTVKLKSEVKKLVDFQLLNLMDTWPEFATYDSIFCRNVMIYFGEKVQSSLIQRFTEILKPGGLLFVGSAESISQVAKGLKPAGPSIYRKSMGKE